MPGVQPLRVGPQAEQVTFEFTPSQDEPSNRPIEIK